MKHIQAETAAEAAPSSTPTVESSCSLSFLSDEGGGSEWSMGSAAQSSPAPPRKRAELEGSCFRVPLHYPRYSRADYEAMPEWRLNFLLAQYGLPSTGDLSQKRSFAMGAFLWPSQ